MATHPDDDAKVAIALAMFAHFKSRSGDVVQLNRITTYCATQGLRTADVADGLAIGVARGFFKETARGAVSLTEVGFAAMPDAE